MNYTQDKLIKRVAIVIQYQGSDYLGWQRQKEGKTIQSLLEAAIERLDPIRPVRTFAAGRTDSGVHAAGQVVHFDTCGHIPSKRWANVLNGQLPQNIRVLQSVEQSLDWHACNSAIYRRYRYSINNSKNANIFLNPWTWHRYQFRLDEVSMDLAAQKLKGFNDFSAFQRSGSNRKNAFTTIQDVHIERLGDMIYLEVQASGFLYGMMRLLVGQLVAIGEHKLSLSTFEKRWKNCLRIDVKEAAPARGLCLLRVGYPKAVFAESLSFDTCPKTKLPFHNSPIAHNQEFWEI